MPFRVDSFSEEIQKNILTVASPESLYIILKMLTSMRNVYIHELYCILCFVCSLFLFLSFFLLFFQIKYKASVVFFLGVLTLALPDRDISAFANHVDPDQLASEEAN